MRLIDADLLEPDAEYDDGEYWAYSKTQIENAPIIELIRCKDCKHWHDAPTSDGYNSCEKDALIRHEDFFCAAAERKEGASS